MFNILFLVQIIQKTLLKNKEDEKEKNEKRDGP